MSPPPWTATHGQDPAVLIIGAGISGICMAIDLLRRNKSTNFVIIEKGNQIGGTWNDNQYPGCCCDVWSHLYSLSYEPNPDWTREYPGQQEIHQYLKNVCHKWGLYNYIRFNTAVVESRWQEKEQKWHTAVEVTGGKAAEFGGQYTIRSDFVVSAVGQLNSPYYPSIEGLDDFKGTLMHSARWDWSKPMAGKRIGIIGNGATAAQVVPELAKTAKSLSVFQRTPNWVVPRDDQLISTVRKAAYRYIPPIRRRYRASLMDIRENFYEVAVIEDSNGNQEVRKQCEDAMRSQLADKPHLFAALTPDYPPGCKRIIISDDYFPALNRPNVFLETEAIQRVTPDGIIVGDKKIELDVLILATGFKTSEFMYPIEVYGENGRSLKSIWPQGARAYLGITVESLPNFSMMYGPNTNLGHNSIILMIEAQSRYISKLIAEVAKARDNGGSLKITPKKATVDSFNEEIQARLVKSTFASVNCRSWYKNENGIVTNNWCGSVIEYQTRVSVVDWNDYQLSGTTAAALTKKNQSHIGRVIEETGSTLLPLLGVLSTAAIATTYILRWRH